MDWQATWDAPFADYLGAFRALIGDKRTAFTFAQTITGIIAAGSLVCSRIAAHAPQLAADKYAAQRILRLVKAQTTARSQLDADHLTAQLRAVAQAQLTDLAPAEIWLVADGSDLRKPYAKQMPNLMQVHDLAGRLVPGYATLNVIALTAGHRYILYHKLYSATAADFVSAPLEEQQAVETVMRSLQQLPSPPVASWILDRGFDSVKLWAKIWQQQAHLVVRIYHETRMVSYRDQQGRWRAGQIKQARSQLQALAQVRTKLTLGKQGREVELAVQLSAVAHKPGKIVLTRGLQRLLDLLASEAILRQHAAKYGELPPQIVAMLGQRKELWRDVS